MGSILDYAEAELGKGRTRGEVASELGMTDAALKSKLQRWRAAGRSSRPTVSDILELPVRPFAVPVAQVAQSLDNTAVRAVVYGDRQVPFHDPKAFAILLKVIGEVKPHIVLNVGDEVDCWQISDYDRDPTRQDSLQDNLDLAREQLAQVTEEAKDAAKWFLEGNHEDRLRKAIWRMPGAAAQLPRLRVFQQVMTMPYLLQLDGIGWTYVETDRQSRTPILPKLISIHGHQLKGSTTVEGASARKAIQKYGRSVIVGHHHRACTVVRRDHNGQSFGIETGCLCLLDGQPYGVDFNWQQAVTVIEWSKNHKVMAVQQVMIRDGNALWRGTSIVAPGAKRIA